MKVLLLTKLNSNQTGKNSTNLFKLNQTTYLNQPNSTQSDPTWPNSTRLNQTQNKLNTADQTQLNLTPSNSTQINSLQPNSFQPNLTQLSQSQLNPTQHNYTKINLFLSSAIESMNTQHSLIHSSILDLKCQTNTQKHITEDPI